MSNRFTVRLSRVRRHQRRSDGRHYARILGYAPSRGFWRDDSKLNHRFGGAVQIAKGLIVRSDQRGYAMIERLLALFQDAELAPAAAASLGTIAEEKDGVLSKENAAVIRVR